MGHEWDQLAGRGLLDAAMAKDLDPPKLRVLIVDDEPIVLRAAHRVVLEVFDGVDVASSAQQGLELLEEHDYAILLSDYRLGAIDGIELCERARRIRPDIVCMLLSGQADFDTALSAINRVGLFRFLTKPWKNEELQKAVEQAGRQYQMVWENHALTSLLARKNAELTQINQQLDVEVQRRTTAMLLSLINALDLRDTETQGHSRRVALYSRRLAMEMKLQGSEVVEVERGALLHDIGKIGVSDTILLKPGKLTEAEWAEMERHSEYGHQILRGIDFLGRAREVVRNHHERFDGSGYPDALQGEEIPLGARIFAVIDAYDAMTSDRPYRKALDPTTAHQELQAQQGVQFDPVCVEAFQQIPQEELDETKRQVELSERAGVEDYRS